MAAIRNDDHFGPRLLVVVLVAVLIGGLTILALTPEPCTDGSGSTICASAPRGAP